MRPIFGARLLLVLCSPMRWPLAKTNVWEALHQSVSADRDVYAVQLNECKSYNILLTYFGCSK